MSVLAEHKPSSSSYRVLYRFGEYFDDSKSPVAGLIDVKGTLYGTTAAGGDKQLGTVFSITTSGQEFVVYSFGRNHPDGIEPEASLTEMNGTLYGTTMFGGVRGLSGCGTVFSLSALGVERLVHEFNSYLGCNPHSSLIKVKGGLYGTTSDTLIAAGGTVYGIGAFGPFHELTRFAGRNGFRPYAGLVSVEGTPYGGALYGTTADGGDYDKGTFFVIHSHGRHDYKKVLHSFAGGANDGDHPVADLIDVNGTFYGTTERGGTYHKGTIFSIDTVGDVHVLHSFSGGPNDGAAPVAGLVDVKGTFYGTTERGGTYDKGTVFSINNSAEEVVLHSFSDVPDGATPRGNLVEVDGTLYGTTSLGGRGDYRGGTVFALSP